MSISNLKTGGASGRTFLWWVLFAGAIVLGSLVLVGVQVNRGFSETQALRAEVIRSYEARAAVTHILSLHQDLETGQRGYVLTGDPRFLQPYRAAALELPSAFDGLRSRWANRPELTAELDELRRASSAKRIFAARTIELIARGDFTGARAEIASGRGKQLMDAIRSTIASIDRAEREQLALRTSQAEGARQTLQQRLVAWQVLLGSLLAIAVAFLVRAYLGWQRTLRSERELASRLETLFDSARDGMLVINESGSIESLNPAVARMFGYEREELRRRDVGTLFEVAPDRGRLETFLRRLAAGKAGSDADVTEFMGRCKDNSLIPAEVSVSPVMLRGRPRFLAVIRDVTERRQIDQMKTEFVSTVSHELRTPLTSISGSLGLIAGGAAGELPERAQRLVDIARSNCARLIRLINDILDLDKIESGRTVFSVKPLPLSALIDQAIDANRAFAASHNVAIELDPVPLDATILGDEDRMMQVLTNLLSNAAKFSPENGTVRVSVTPLDRRYRISVADQGPGIPEEFRERIFGKFAQADASDSRQKGGTGLGLSIVRQIVERLGGSVDFDSTPGQGAIFHVDLPAAEAMFAGDAKAEPLGRISSAEAPLVLHVDDDPDMLRIVDSALEGEAQVHSSPSLPEAVAAIRRYSFDAIVLDIDMAEGSGLDLLPLIREHQRAPVIVFTAQDVDPLPIEGVDVLLVKSRESLERLKEEVLRLAKARREELR
jgi:PAS domain S-box-containing protein